MQKPICNILQAYAGIPVNVWWMLFQNGTLEYLAPEFEIGAVLGFMLILGTLNCGYEHESLYALFSKILLNYGITESAVFYRLIWMVF